MSTARHVHVNIHVDVSGFTAAMERAQQSMNRLGRRLRRPSPDPAKLSRMRCAYRAKTRRRNRR